MMQNKVQLITYADRITGQDINALTTLLNGSLKGVFGGVHLLPFYNPIDGSVQFLCFNYLSTACKLSLTNM